MRRRPVIAIDGPAGAGKSTVARALAGRLGYAYVDSGAMYRAIGLAVRERGVDIGDATALGALIDAIGLDLSETPNGQRVLLDGRDVTEAIREPLAGEWASRVAAVQVVRARLVHRQRALAAAGGVVMDGRDIGTTVFPDAEYKFFLTATPEVRARRRERDLAASGASGSLASIRAAIEERDRRDEERAHSPLRPAVDAIVIDTTTLTTEEVVTHILSTIADAARP